jgi:hypothetical protein
MFNDKQKLTKIILNFLNFKIKKKYEEEIEEKSFRTRKKIKKKLE